MKSLLIISIYIFLINSLCAHNKPIWPTPNHAFFENKPLEAYVQPTASGKIASGCFGCVRKNKSGHSAFHEGLDLFPLKRNKKNEPLDPIYAIWPGKIVYMNHKGGNSNYGIYIVLEHDDLSLKCYTLYAHLSKITPDLQIGQIVDQGTILGCMGYTSADRIPKTRAHLHFEIGFRLSNNFNEWYNKNNFNLPNYHANWNGMNLIGIDPLGFFAYSKTSPTQDLTPYIQSLPTAFTLEIQTTTLPDFIKRHPSLLSTQTFPLKIKGWQIDFTWYGLPKLWRPILQNGLIEGSLKNPKIISYDESLLKNNPCRKTIVFDKKNKPQIGPELQKILEILF